MSKPPLGDDSLLRRSEIAALAGVSRPTVTAWEKQGDGFPTPRRSSGQEYFRKSEILDWLDRRPVPRRSLVEGEEPGITYGDRARRSRATERLAGGLSGGDADLKPSTGLSNPGDQQVARELMGKLVDRVRGVASDVDYLNLLLSLHYLREADGSRWTAFLGRSRSLGGLDAAALLLRDVGRAVDEGMRRVGVDTTMAEALVRLEPRTARDLWKVFDGVSRLREDVSGLILDEYQQRAALGSGEFFTPRAVVQLMTRLACDGHERGRPGSVYDPFARGGEFLLEAATAFIRAEQDEPPVAVRAHGDTRQADTWRLASMNLALHGIHPDLELGRTVPWEDDARRRTPAPFDIVLTNPPFNMRDSAGQAREQGQWPYGAPPADNDNFAYVQHCLTVLDERGCAGIIMPNKAGNSGHRAEREIRKNLVEAGVVTSVIALPGQLFTGTSVPVSVWLLGHPTNPREEVLFLDGSQLGTKNGPQRVLDDQDVELLLNAYDACRAGGSQVGALGPSSGLKTVPTALVPRAELRLRGYSLNPIDHIEIGNGVEDAEAELAAGRERLDELNERLQRVQTAAAQTPYGGLAEPPMSEVARFGPPVPLGSLCEIKAGPSFSKLGTAQRTADGEVSVVYPRHLRGGHISDEQDERTSLETAHRLSAFSLEEGDIVCVRTGAIGPPALVRSEQHGWLMSPNVIRLRAKESAEVLPEYLLYYLCRASSVRWMRDRAASTAAPSLRTESLGSLPIPLPTLSEQREIVETLMALDRLDRLHQECASALQQTRTALADILMSPPAEPAPRPPSQVPAPHVLPQHILFEKGTLT